MKKRYLVIFLIIASGLLVFYLAFLFLIKPERESLAIISTKEDIHTVLEDGVWRINHPDFIPQFGADLQNTGVYPGNGIREIQRVEDVAVAISHDNLYKYHKAKLIYKIRHKGRINSSPAVFEGIVYFGTSDGNLYAVDAYTGIEKWITRIGQPLEKMDNITLNRSGTPRSLPPAIFSSPVIFDNTAFFGTAYGYAYALDIKNGNIIWRTEIPGLHLANPKIYKNNLYIGSKDRHLYKLDSGTGDIIWSYSTRGEINSTPAIYDDNIFINCQDGYLYSIGIDSSLNWETDIGCPTRNSPAVYEDILFLGADCFYAVNVYNGKVLWKTEPRKNISQCAVSKGRVYFSASAIAATYFSASAIAAKNIKMSCKYLYSYNAKDGSEEWISILGSSPFDPLTHSEPGQEEGNSDLELPGSQVIISGDIIHLFIIGNYMNKVYDILTGRIYGFYDNLESNPDLNQNTDINYLYAYNIAGLSSPVVIDNEIAYFGSEKFHHDGWYTALCSIESTEHVYRWQPRLLDLQLYEIYDHFKDYTLPVVSDDNLIIHDLILKDGSISENSEHAHSDEKQNASGIAIASYDINTKKETYSGVYELEDAAPLKIFKRSSAVRSGRFFLEIGEIEKIFKKINDIKPVLKFLLRIKLPVKKIQISYIENRIKNNSYHSFDINTGKLIWKYDVGPFILNSPPLFYEDNIYIGSCYIFRDKLIQYNLIDFDNIFLAINSKNGKEEWKISVIGNIISRPLLYNDILYFGTDRGYVYAVDRFGGKLIWKFCISGGISSTPAVYNDIIFIGSWNWNIYAINAKTGRGLWKFRTRGEVRSKIYEHNGNLQFLSIIPPKDADFLRYQANKGNFTIRDYDADSRTLYIIRKEPELIERDSMQYSCLQSLNIESGIERWEIRGDISQALFESDIIYTLNDNNLQAVSIIDGSIIWGKKADIYQDKWIWVKKKDKERNFDIWQEEKEIKNYEIYREFFLKKYLDKIFIVLIKRKPIEGTQPDIEYSSEVYLREIDSKTGKIEQDYKISGNRIHF